MGTQTTQLATLLELLYELTQPPSEAWAYKALKQGLASTDPAIRELAIGAAAGSVGMVAALQDYAARERSPWLARYATLVAQDLRARD